ncbi:MAG TPA: HAMP domain-containing sensor histidine kinase [Sphingomonas sp.]|nr:HAMP domain-containing sensor histidine kinase [Sphingomonas sp.]
MRFDDSLDTVLAADIVTPFGAETAWRQLIDLIGRRRAVASAEAMARLDTLRQRVPAAVRAASARALEHAEPPVEIVRLLALDTPEIAAPVLRGARLPAEDWIALLPSLGQHGRAVLRHRRDLDSLVEQALASFGHADFVLTAGEAASIAAEAPKPKVPNAPLGPSPFVSLGEAALTLPAVTEALRHADAPNATPTAAPTGPFQISELVARIAAYQRQRDAASAEAASESAPARACDFRFETDASGVVRWVEGVSRAPLIGLSLDLASLPGGSRVDGIAAGAFRRRAAFANARLVVEGASDAAGDWRISGTPAFDPATGRFTGYRGTARRPRADEQAAPAGKVPLPPDSLRQLVHELRTPTNAIAGFAEMIECELLGPVSASYRERASVIRDHARDLLTAIEDLDLAARIEGKALDLRGGQLALRPLLDRIVGDLAPLAELRGAVVAIDPDLPPFDVVGDERAVERLVGRLMAALVAAGGRGETIRIEAAREDAHVAIRFDRPAALTVQEDDALLSIDTEQESAGEGAPLLGVGFALRLVRNLAAELGGSLQLSASRLTLRLPAAVTGDMGQASTN